MFSDIDIRHMESAIALAEHGAGLNHPNPLVGCIVAIGEEVVGSGYHLYDKIDHAEPLALKEAGDRAKGATLYVNLEPCTHICRTPPCTDAIISAGINRVVYAVQDPDCRVNGRGHNVLQNAGIRVDSGLCYEKAYELNRDFFKAKLTNLPWVITKTAMSLDGKIGLYGVHGEYFSSRENLRIAHELRAFSDAIMVGAGTIRIDNPRLTCRLDSFDDLSASLTNDIIYPKSASRKNPIRVIISKSLDLPIDSHVFRTNDARTIVLTAEDSNPKIINIFEEKGVEIIRLSCHNGNIDLNQAFRSLLTMGIMNIMVEGGGNLIGSLIASDLVDEIYLSISPVLIGGSNSPTWIERSITDNIANAPKLKVMKSFQSGHDLLVRGRFI